MHLANRDQSQRHGAIRFDHIHERTLGAALDAGARHDHDLAAHVDQHTGIDELIREQGMVGICKLRLEFHGPGAGVDLVVDREKGAGGKPVFLCAVIGIHRRLVATLQFFHNRRYVVFRDREQDRDRLQLRDHHQAAGVAGAHDVAGIDLTQAEAPTDRRGDTRVAQLQLRIVDQSLIRLNRALVLPYQRLLRVELLPGDRILLKQQLVAHKVDLRIGQQRLVPRHLALGLCQLHLEGPRVYFRQQLAGLHHLAFAKQYLHQLAVDTAAYRHRVQRHRRAKPVQIHADVAGARRCRNHWRRRSIGAATRSTSAAFAATGPVLAWMRERLAGCRGGGNIGCRLVAQEKIPDRCRTHGQQQQP